MDRERLAQVAQEHGILLAVQFGSSVTGRMHAASDVDVAVLLARAPDSLQAYADLIADLQIVDADFARRIARCTGLRNRLVHEYNDIDPAQVFDSLAAALTDIPVYMQAIEAAVVRSDE